MMPANPIGLLVELFGIVHRNTRERPKACQVKYERLSLRISARPASNSSL